MTTIPFKKIFIAAAACLSLLAGACTGSFEGAPREASGSAQPQYIVGPGDVLNIFVWRNPELSVSLPVRPDGQISVPLIEDMMASGSTPTELARDLEKELSKFIQDPIVTVIVAEFSSPVEKQVRIVGEVGQPSAIAYSNNMTVMDAVIEVGGLTTFAAGNRTVIVRRVGGEEVTYNVRLDDLMKDGDISANVELRPGDVLIVPESWL